MPFRNPVQPPPLSGVREAFQDAAEYAYSLGVSRKNVRLRAYNDFLNAILRETQESFVSDEAMRLWREIHELIFVLSAFKNNNLTPPNDLLKKSLDGKPLEEYEHETGRNFFLELRAAIYFLRVGYAIILGQDCDIVAVRNRQRIFIECKRLYSEKKAGRRVRECYEQLETRLAAADRSYNNLGLAWVDPSAAMQKYYFFFTAYSEAGAREAARMDLVYFWREWIAKAYNGRERRIFALVLQMVWPSWVARSQGIRTGFTSYVLPGHRKTGFFGLFRARKLLDEIMSIEEALNK